MQGKIYSPFKSNLVVVRYLASGTHQNDWMGMSGTGKKFSAGGIIILQLKDGKLLPEGKNMMQ